MEATKASQKPSQKYESASHVEEAVALVRDALIRGNAMKITVRDDRGGSGSILVKVKTAT